MSTDEQDAAIGRLVRERKDADRQCALIAEEITGKFSSKASNLYGNLTGLFKDATYTTSRLKSTIAVVEAIVEMGGLDRLKSLLSEHATLSQRIAEIGDTLRKAGAE